jgi:hypothetical protein
MNSYLSVAAVLDKVPANWGYLPGFTVAIILENAVEAVMLYQQFHDMGRANLDLYAIIDFLEKRNQTID